MKIKIRRKRKMEKKKHLFKRAVNESSFFKCIVFSFQGGGKTFTAGKLGVGLHNHINSKKPVCFIDSEGGVDKLIGKFEENKIELWTKKTRAFSELLELCKEAESISDILIIDSITHFWTELVESYMDKMKISRMSPHHWIPVKKTYKQFSQFFSFSKLHIIACGRSGWRFGYHEEEDGSKQMAAIETKIKAEGEFGYEADLLLELERIREEVGTIGAKNIRRCWVLKDKWDSIDGRYFDNPEFKDFLPHIKHLNLKGKMHSVDLQKTSQEMFDERSQKSRVEYAKKRDIFLEEIKQELIMKFGSDRSEKSQQEKIKLLRKTFGTGAWGALESKTVEILEKGLKEIKKTKVKEEKK